MSYLLETRELYKYYSKKKQPALNGLTLNIPQGRIIGLLGPNGSGKTTLIKLINGLLTPTSGSLAINGHMPGTESKAVISYLPERTCLSGSMRVRELISFFADFYADFSVDKAYDMLASLEIHPDERLKTLSKGTREKVQLIMVMSRNTSLYVLDEPIGGVDPAARDYILRTIISNYSEEATVLISTHLITDIEQVLDEVIFIRNGQVITHMPVDRIREEYGQSVDAYFRRVFAC